MSHAIYRPVDIQLALDRSSKLAAQLGFRRYHLDELDAGHDPGFVETKFTDEGDHPERTVDLNCSMK